MEISEMRPTFRILALAALLAIAGATAPAQTQQMRMSTMVDNMVGAAGDMPAARLLFVRDEDDLCVMIAVLTGPTALKAPLFRFAHRVEGKTRAQQLKFALPKKPVSATEHGDRVQVWEGCLDGELNAGLEPGVPSAIAVQYHDPRLLRERADHAVPFPAADAPRGVDVLKDSAGSLLFREYRPEPAELL